jgi:phosphoglycolate phosphatase
MAYKAILFDLDGTLLDTLDDLADASNETLQELGFPAHPVDSYRYFVGDGVDNLMRRALPEDNRDEDSVRRAVELQMINYGKRWDAKTRPYDGIMKMLSQLHTRQVRMAILSNKPDEFTKLCVTQLLPVHLFDIVIGARDGVPRKPNPAAAVEIAGRLGILPADFLYLGDTNTDMQTAVSAGMTAVGALWGFREAEELRAAGARHLIETPEALLDLLA